MTYENPVIRFLNKMTDLMVLNILFIVCSLPVFTLGASLTAMYAVNLRSVRDGDGYVVKRFFKAFKENFRQSTVAWLIMLGTILILYIDYRFWAEAGDAAIAKFMNIAGMVIALFIGMVSVWLFPVIAKMEDTFKVQVINAVKMSFAFFVPGTVACMAFIGLAAYLTINNVGFMIIMIVLGIAFINWICCFFIYKGFARVIKEDPIGNDDYLYMYGEKEEQKNDFTTEKKEL